MPAARDLAAAVAAVPAVVAAAVRVAYLYPRRGLDRLTDELRAGPRSGSPRQLRARTAVLDRLLPVLPPRAMGRCLKRSLVLLRLASRLGYRPVLHIAVGEGGSAPAGHAWLTGLPGSDESSPPAAVVSL